MTGCHNEWPAVLIPAGTIARRVAELGAEISSDYLHVMRGGKGGELVLLGVLKGAFVFVADLARALSIPVVVDFISAASYGSGRVSSGIVAIDPTAWPYGTGRDVLIVEDVLDTGRTLEAVVAYISKFDPKSVKTAALLRKPKAKFNVDYAGFDIEDRFVVGCGLDDAGRWRHLPYVGVVSEDTGEGLVVACQKTSD